ncbi:MAG: dihydrolipoyl dehydrogenase [Candidatus Krumholzibacteriia bacterium]
MAAESRAVQVAVIGAGPGGYAAAFLAADLGLSVALIDPAPNPGGVCLYRGCIPSKALLHVARVVSETREAADWGVTFSAPQIDFKKTGAWKDRVVQTLTAGLGQLCKQRKVRYVQGRAKFTGSAALAVETADGAVETVTFEHAVLATGSRPAVIPALNLDSPRVLDSTTALELDDVPASLLVVGGGYIGLELGTVYATLGSRVSVVEMMPQLLPGADADLVRPLHKRVEGLFDSLMLETTVTGLKDLKNGVRVAFEGKNAPVKEMLFERVLVAAGRRPNSGDLGLENTRVEVDEKGFVRVDSRRRTDEPSIFAIGDVAGEPMLAHKASHEGRHAVEVIAGKDVVFEPQAIPAVVFTDPEVAWCGLTESAARASGQEVKVAKYPWAASGRAKTLGRGDGLTRWIVDPETERILGAGIVGPGAGELIAEAALAIEMAATIGDLKLTIHPHPTLSETLMEAAEVFFGQSTHVYRPSRG